MEKGSSYPRTKVPRTIEQMIASNVMRRLAIEHIDDFTGSEEMPVTRREGISRELSRLIFSDGDVKTRLAEIREKLSIGKMLMRNFENAVNPILQNIQSRADIDEKGKRIVESYAKNAKGELSLEYFMTKKNLAGILFEKTGLREEYKKQYARIGNLVDTTRQYIMNEVMKRIQTGATEKSEAGPSRGNDSDFSIINAAAEEISAGLKTIKKIMQEFAEAIQTATSSISAPLSAAKQPAKQPPEPKLEKQPSKPEIEWTSELKKELKEWIHSKTFENSKVRKMLIAAAEDQKLLAEGFTASDIKAKMPDVSLSYIYNKLQITTTKRTGKFVLNKKCLSDEPRIRYKFELNPDYKEEEASKKDQRRIELEKASAQNLHDWPQKVSREGSGKRKSLDFMAESPEKTIFTTKDIGNGVKKKHKDFDPNYITVYLNPLVNKKMYGYVLKREKTGKRRGGRDVTVKYWIERYSAQKPIEDKKSLEIKENKLSAVEGYNDWVKTKTREGIARQILEYFGGQPPNTKVRYRDLVNHFGKNKRKNVDMALYELIRRNKPEEKFQFVRAEKGVYTIEMPAVETKSAAKDADESQPSTATLDFEETLQKNATDYQVIPETAPEETSEPKPPLETKDESGKPVESVPPPAAEKEEEKLEVGPEKWQKEMVEKAQEYTSKKAILEIDGFRGLRHPVLVE